MNWQNTYCRCFLRLTNESVLVKGAHYTGTSAIALPWGAGSGTHACIDLNALSPEQLCAQDAQLIVQVIRQEREAA
jgi:hypothetical protein